MTIKANKLKTISKFVLKVVFVVFTAVSINNISKQVGVFLRAKQENVVLAEKVQKLETDNIILEQNIRYATSSAYIDAMARDKFGLGGIDDYWIIGPEMDIEEEKMILEEHKNNWQKWLELFTK